MPNLSRYLVLGALIQVGASCHTGSSVHASARTDRDTSAIPTSTAARMASEPGQERPLEAAHVCANVRPAARLSVDGGPFVELATTRSATRGRADSPVFFGLYADTPQVDHVVPARDIAWIKFAVDALGEHTLASPNAQLLYWHYPAASQLADPSMWIHHGEVAGTISVTAAARGEGDRTCGQFDLTLDGEHQLHIVGTFHHQLTSARGLEESLS